LFDLIGAPVVLEASKMGKKKKKILKEES